MLARSIVFVFAGALAPLCAADRLSDPVAITERMVVADSANRQIARQYTWVQRSEERDLDEAGRITSTKSETFDITFLGHRPYRRLVAENDKPLTPEAEAKQEERFRKEAAKRAKESAKEAEELRKEEEKQRESFRKMIAELPKAFHLKLAGIEKLDGRDVYKITADPRADYNRRLPPYSMLKKLKGTMWIDCDEFQMVKVEAEAIDTLSVGFVLARVSAGTRFGFESARVNNEVWLPKRASAKIDARLGVFKKYRQETQTTWSKYRKFTTDSRIVSTGSVEHK